LELRQRVRAHFASIAVVTSGLIGSLYLMLPAAGPAEENGAEYADPGLCALCHKDVGEEAGKRLHGAILERRASEALGRNCQTCHGPSQTHAEDPIEIKPAWTPDSLGRRTSAIMCLTCHSKQVSPMTWRRGDHHAGEVQCWECHSADRPAKAHSEYIARPQSSVCVECHHEVRGLFRLNSHHPVLIDYEQRIECADCHRPHGRIRDRDITALCRTCHLAQRGPFRFEHGAISGRLMASCVECHQPHGSPNADLLRFNARGLCLQCHGDRATHFPGPKCWTCHQAVHGSNSSPYLLR